MFFRDIIGQMEIKCQLLKSVQNGYIPHARLIYGNSGTGSLALALGYARYLHCKNRQKEDSCGECPSCFKFDKLIHPDLHFVFPIFNKDKKGKKGVFCDEFLLVWRKFLLETPYGGLATWLKNVGADNDQVFIYARESDEIIRKLNLKSYEFGYKIIMIWLPEKMHETTSNKLLKILEEPPEKTIFLLVSENLNLVPATIRSRTDSIFVPPIANRDIHLALEKNYNIPNENIQLAVRLSRGNYEMAKRFVFSTKQNEEYLFFFRTMMLNAYLEKYKDIKLEMEKFASFTRDKQKKTLVYAQHMIRENFLFCLNEQKISYMDQKESEFSIKFHPYINETNIVDLMEELTISEYHIESNVNPRIVFFDLSLKIIELLKRTNKKYDER